MNTNKQPVFMSTIIYLFVVASSLFYFLSIGWLKWGDSIIDTGERLWLPAQILKGRVLYEDFIYIYGFFPLHFLALIYKIFGIHIISLVGCGIVITILITIFIYKISLLFINKEISLVIVLTFLYVFAFGFYQHPCIFNFILPYRFESTFFILFISFSLFLFLKFILFKKEKYLFFWSIAMSFAFFSRILISIIPYLAFIIIGEFYIWKDNGKKAWHWRLYLVAPFFISLSGYICYVLFLFKTRSFAALTESLSYCLKYALIENTLTTLLAGLDDITRNITLMFASFFAHLLIMVLLTLSVIVISSFLTNKKKSYLFFILAIIVVSVFIACTQHHIIISMQYRCLPLILIAGVTMFLVKTLRSSDHRRPLALLTLFLISLSLILRIFFQTTPYGYGFYLLPLSLICYYLFFFKLLQDFLQKIHFNKYIKFCSVVLGIFFIFSIIPYGKKSFSMYANKNIKVETDKGPIFFSEELKALRIKEMIEYLKENTYENDKLVVFPEGAGLNFFSQRENPLKIYFFLPQVIKLLGQERIISWLIQHEVDYIIILQRETPEYGYPCFGIHYGQKISLWIYDKYSVVEQFGPAPFTSDEFSAVILKKKSVL